MPLIYIDIGWRAEERKKDYEKRKKTITKSKIVATIIIITLERFRLWLYLQVLMGPVLMKEVENKTVVFRSLVQQVGFIS